MCEDKEKEPIKAKEDEFGAVNAVSAVVKPVRRCVIGLDIDEHGRPRKVVSAGKWRDQRQFVAVAKTANELENLAMEWAERLADELDERIFPNRKLKPGEMWTNEVKLEMRSYVPVVLGAGLLSESHGDILVAPFLKKEE